MLYPQRRQRDRIRRLVRIRRIANAENNLDMARDTLYVAEIFADQRPDASNATGPAPKGSAASILQAHEPHYRHLGSGEVGGYTYGPES